MDNSIVSIVMPFRNTSAFLEECMLSIIEQSYDDWELIAVNDHSTDKSKEIIEYFQKLDERVTVIENKGKGIIDALVSGYRVIRGTYITRMDSDDMMHPDKILTMKVNLDKSTGGQVATGGVEYFAKHGVGQGYKAYAKWLNTLTKNGANFQEIYKECVIPSPCWMMRCKEFELIGGFASRTYPEDYDLCFRMYQASMKVIPETKVLHFWRDYPTRTSRTDDHYQDNRFLTMKLNYFLSIEYEQDTQLIVLGAGKKGKAIARFLMSNGIVFRWMTNNLKKIGREIYGQVLIDEATLRVHKSSKIIVSIANHEEKAELINRLNALGYQLGQDYFPFA